MKKFSQLLSAIIFLGYGFQAQAAYSGLGLGEQFGAANSSDINCMCARQVAAGMKTDPQCEQNVKAMVDRAVQSSPQLNPMQFQMPAHMMQQQAGGQPQSLPLAQPLAPQQGVQ